MEGLNFSISAEPFDMKYYFRIGLFQNNMLVSVAQPLCMETTYQGVTIQPSFTLTKIEAQCLMDKLWEAGIRPMEHANVVNAVSAVKYHLEDMRKIVFDYLMIHTVNDRNDRSTT